MLIVSTEVIISDTGVTLDVIPALRSLDAFLNIYIMENRLYEFY